jgi:hypothetical protein
LPNPRCRSAQPAALIAIKAAHTALRALMVACIVAMPYAAWRGEYRAAAWLTLVVAAEVLVLAVHRGRCPLTSVAGRFTDQRGDNFDIWLPLWLARHNKSILGALYLAGLLYAVSRWLGIPAQGSATASGRLHSVLQPV